MMTMWMVGALALAQDGAVVGEAEAVVVPETSVGLETPVSVGFTVEGDVSVSAVELTNTQGTAFRFAGANELGPIGGDGRATVELVYAPTTEGRHQAEITVVSDAACTEPATVLVRGAA